jgi:hypothetical protein
MPLTGARHQVTSIAMLHPIQNIESRRRTAGRLSRDVGVRISTVTDIAQLQAESINTHWLSFFAIDKTLDLRSIAYAGSAYYFSCCAAGQPGRNEGSRSGLVNHHQHHRDERKAKIVYGKQ